MIDSASHWALQTEKQGGRRATLLGYPAESFPMVNPYWRQKEEAQAGIACLLGISRQDRNSVGIQVAGSGATYSSGSNRGKCSDGFNCKVIFQQWSNIEARFNLALWTAF